ncbi:hypothetical protein M0R88_16200 [Halorussus gelatinilyticus]|uniref:Uncharacterized protein n=1 Tax=Halorussus gelatinilyticus TaxID=2937524 RepID=A0A8U0IIE4_9EURY|nr:hypothetical protein [Halorussus gelatinilyticus]UPW00042.1 hypothetical protein M0R88_16200 [Halorussus gelatinilyticus]
MKITFNEQVDISTISASDVQIAGSTVDSIVAGNAGGSTSLTVKVNSELQTATKPKVAISGGYTETTGDTKVSGDTVVHTARLDLSQGENFVSVPAAAGALDVSNLDSSNIEQIITYEKSADGSNWQFHSFDGNSKNDDFDYLEGGQGYIFVMSSDDTVDVNVQNVPASVAPGEESLEEGWNLIGHWQEGSQNANTALSSLNSGTIGDTVHQMYEQSDGSNGFSYTSVDFSSSTTDKLSPGEAYWIFVKDDEVYTEAGYAS